MDKILQTLSERVTQARDLESLTRPLLEMLEAVTGLESTYLTEIDEGQSTQHIRYARNVAGLQIPEGAAVDWSDTLCRRAIDEGRLFTDNVAECWGDSDAARIMGIRTYLSSPVRTSSGSLYGTLCAASAERKPMVAGSEQLIGFFARLIAEHVEREQLLQQLQRANDELSRRAPCAHRLYRSRWLQADQRHPRSRGGGSAAHHHGASAGLGPAQWRHVGADGGR